VSVEMLLKFCGVKFLFELDARTRRKNGGMHKRGNFSMELICH
jgi:hypothetical protein